MRIQPVLKFLSLLGGYMFCTRLSVLLRLHASMCASKTMFPRYLQYLWLDFHP